MSIYKPMMTGQAAKNADIRGFTLLEMLLSLAVFAMLGMATYSVLNNTINGKQAIIEQSQKLTELQRAISLIEADFIQLSQRRMRIDGEAPESVFFIAQEYLFDSESIGFGFVRDGWTNPVMVLPRSESQPVAYRVKEQRLERLYYNFVDNLANTEPRIQPLLTEVTELKLSYFYQSSWHSDLPENRLPELVKLSFITASFGYIERIFPLITLTDQSK